MKHPALEHRKNPFAIDGLQPPVARSPLAILDVDPPRLESEGVDHALAIARALLEREPEMALVYGARIGPNDLEWAAERLRQPEGRLLAELLDFPHHEVDLGDREPLREALAAAVADLGEPRGPRPSDLGLVAELVARVNPAPEPEELAPFVPRLPELPSSASILSELI
ncbi:MAG: hypothetical protein R3F20_07055 [Planctomycetota bacterium]